MSRQAILGPEGIVHGAPAGAVVVDASTVSPGESRAMGEELAAHGIHFLGAPCTGSRPGAEGGTLTFMIGGDQAVFERVRPHFEPMGKRLYYCGGPGMGLHAKLTQNLILSNLMMAFNEGMVLAAKAGVEPRLMLDILDNSAAKSGLIAFKAPYVFRRDFSPNFSVKWMHKDLGLILDSAAELDVPPVIDLRHPPTLPGGHLERPWRRGFLLCNQGVRGNGWGRGEGRSGVTKKNTDFCCIPSGNILLLESSRGGNSHQSETNL
jgi:3-hydroxyisobutyrate dehydrogenase/2-hydroxy-3-oxopropionate reductase